MPDLTVAEGAFLTVGAAGFTAFGCCLVYLIADERLMPVWLEQAVLAALQARDRARLAFVTALLALAIRLNAPASAPKGAHHA